MTLRRRRHVKASITIIRKFILVATLAGFVNAAVSARAGATNDIRIVNLQGSMEIIRRGSATGVKTTDTQQPPLQPFDRVRTGPDSRVTLLWTDQSPVTFGALTELEILPPHDVGTDSGLHLIRGILSFLHRDQPGRIRVITRGATAGIKGTEFMVEVVEAGDTERTTLSVMDGIVTFTNELAALVLTNGQQAVAEPGRAPVRTAGFNATNLLQWCFYYPAVLDLNDLTFSFDEENLLHESLAAYRAGDLLAALAKYPAGQSLDSEAARIYHAALLLSVGQVEQGEEILKGFKSADPAGKYPRLANALHQLIAAVKHEVRPATASPQLATEWLAASYYEQSRAQRETSLTMALHLAQQAVTNSPEFGFGWERVAELEFGFGRTERALEALNKSLKLAPRNAEALALKGFLLAAQNQPRAAIEWFDRALAVDSALGNAWLGRGLCRIRLGEARSGRTDLLLAAALEPQRAALRSYLGKAWSDAGDDSLARKELGLARKLDANDPTSWLYSALNNEQHNRINEAIRDLEKSQELNDNRAVYRSGLLLDQDRAVRSVNLARIYDEAGLGEVAVREASRAVAADYGNYAAHLFLANSYEQLRQSSPFDLRFETPAFGEYLLASLLGPADGRLLAQPVTQQEYGSLFERDTFGINSSTEYLSRGAWNQYAAQYGTFRNSSYALESGYQWDPGQTPNGSVESWQMSLKLKQMLTPKDGLFVQVSDAHQTSGDLSQRYDPSQANLGFETHEEQAPSVLIGYDHKWNESQHTLFLASHFDDSLQLQDPHGRTFLLGISGDGSTTNFVPTDLTQILRSQLRVESFEVQHLASFPNSQTIAGLRVQSSHHHLYNNDSYFFDNNAHPLDPVDWNALFFDRGDGNPVVARQSFDFNSLHIAPYLYEYWRVADPLWLIGGVTYDYQSQPRNALFAPLDNTRRIQRQFSPKAGLIWTPAARSTVRFAYSQSLGGASLDQSVRLEPTQLAGFVQSYRNLIPAAFAGNIGGAKFETIDLSLEHRFVTSTYVALSAQLLRSTADHSVGAFLHDINTANGPIEQLNERLNFCERSVEASVHQLLGDYFSVGLRYRVTDARLTINYPEISPIQGTASSMSSGILHFAGLDTVFQHPSGFFAKAEGQWWLQDLRAGLAGLPGDQFWQANFMAGYRSPRRHVELSAGVLNLTGQNYHLSPINLHPNLPRQRTFVARLQLNF